VAFFHYPFFPHPELALAVQFRILSLSAAPMDQLYNGRSYVNGLSPMGLQAIAATHEALATCEWRLPTLAEVRAVHAQLFPAGNDETDAPS
jgi:hypothetical protein